MNSLYFHFTLWLSTHPPREMDGLYPPSPSPCRLTPIAEVNLASQLGCGSADTQSVPLSEMLVEACDCTRQNTNEGAFLPSDGSAPNPDLGGLMRTRLGSGCNPPAQQARWLQPGHQQGMRQEPPALGRQPLGTHAWSVQTNEFPAQYLKQWLHWKGFALC